jgi:hypothetical protein
VETSDKHSQSASQEQLALAGGHPGPLEEMRAKAASGELLDYGKGPFDLGAMQSWGAERTVNAVELRELLVGAELPVHAKGVRLRGVRIIGLLDLEGATLRCPLSLDCCYLDSDDPVCLDHATASRVALTRCQLAGLTASMLTARQVNLSRSTFRAGPLSLMCANITDELICSGAHLKGTDSGGNALVAGGMRVGGSVYLDDRFTAHGAAWLARTEIAGDLACDGAQLGRNRHGIGLLAEGTKVGGEVFLRKGFTAEGAVRLLGADITGDLSCSAAQLGHDDDGNALVADRIRVGGEAHLYNGFTTRGAVVLNGADITGDLSFRSAQLNGTNRDGNALDADGIKAGHDVLLDKELGDGAEPLPFTASGAVRLVRANITGQLSCSGAQLNGTDHYGRTLMADGMKVGSAVLLDDQFSAVGTVWLNSIRADQLVVSPAKRVGANEIIFNFTAEEAQIARVLRWAPDGQFSGQVNLENAYVGELEDNWTSTGDQAQGGWPFAGGLRLSGLTYGGLADASVEQRLKWIRSQYQGDKPASFAAQPYEQLAAMYRQAGQEGEARTVAIARRQDLRKYGKLNWYRKFGNWFLDKTIRYGYQTWRAAVGLAVVFVAFLALSLVGQHQHVIVPVGDTKDLHPVPTATQCTHKYPCFYPFGYTVDTVIPIINVHQAEYWGPDGHASAGWVWVVSAWGATAVGWALATLLVAGYTGLVRQD